MNLLSTIFLLFLPYENNFLFRYFFFSLFTFLFPNSNSPPASTLSLNNSTAGVQDLNGIYLSDHAHVCTGLPVVWPDWWNRAPPPARGWWFSYWRRCIPFHGPKRLTLKEPKNSRAVAAGPCETHALISQSTWRLQKDFKDRSDLSQSKCQ